MAERPLNEKEKQESALLLLWVLLAIGSGFLIWLAVSRYHISKTTLIEIGLYAALLVYLASDLVHLGATLPIKRVALWPPTKPHIGKLKRRTELELANSEGSVLVGYEGDKTQFRWSEEARAWQTIASGQSGSGKSTLIETILQQDIARGIPILFLDGKGEKKMLDKVLPAIAAAGRLHQLRLIDPSQPEISWSFNPLYAPDGDIDEHVGFVFESFKVDGGDDFFDQHQRVYLENIGRILHYSGKRFNFYDVLVTAYDEAVMKRQMKIAFDRAKADPETTPTQMRALEMSIKNLLTNLEDKERVPKIQGLLNHLSTYMSDAMAVITGPYDNVLSIEDVLDNNLILYVSLNVNVNQHAVTSLGRIILQALQLTLGKRYAHTGYGKDHPFVSVLLDEFAPFAYQNFSTILQTARGANVAFMFALQNYNQLTPAGFGLKESLSTGPNNTFVLRMKDDSNTRQVRAEGGEVRKERFAMQVQKGGVLAPGVQESGLGSRSEVYETEIRDEQLKRLPTGQMRVLMTDQQIGLKHMHIHVNEPIGHFFMGGEKDDAGNHAYYVDWLYPTLESPMCEGDGLNLRFPLLDLDSQFDERTKRRRGRPAGRGK
jgi:hypothetical protein